MIILKFHVTAFVEFVDPSLTSIYQPPGDLYNKPFKLFIRKKCNEFVTNELMNKKVITGD